MRIPFSLFGITINLGFAIFGWDFPNRAIVQVSGYLLVPTAFIMCFKQLRLISKHGVFFPYRSLAYSRWALWSLLWPTVGEPAWRKRFAIATMSLVIVSATTGIVRWGLSPPN